MLDTRLTCHGCFDITSNRIWTTGNYDPNVTTPEGYDPKTVAPGDITSAIRQVPDFTDNLALRGTSCHTRHNVQPLLLGLWHDIYLHNISESGSNVTSLVDVPGGVLLLFPV